MDGDKHVPFASNENAGRLLTSTHENLPAAY
jgi:hypothetical protein